MDFWVSARRRWLSSVIISNRRIIHSCTPSPHPGSNALFENAFASVARSAVACAVVFTPRPIGAAVVELGEARSDRDGACNQD